MHEVVFVRGTISAPGGARVERVVAALGDGPEIEGALDAPDLAPGEYVVALPAAAPAAGTVSVRFLAAGEWHAGDSHQVALALHSDPLAGCVERETGWAFALDGVFAFDERLGDVRGLPLTLTLRPADVVELRGWCVDVAVGRPAEIGLLGPDGLLRAVSGFQRPDVEANLGLAGAAASGFALPLGADASTELRLVAWTPGAGVMHELGRVHVRSVAEPRLPLRGAIGFARGSIDRVAETVADFMVYGWADAAEASLTLVVDERVGYPAYVGIERGDVAEGEHAPELLRSGFVAAVPRAELSAGIHELRLVAAQAEDYALAAHVDVCIEDDGACRTIR